MSPVTSLVLLFAFSYVSSDTLPDAQKILPIPVKEGTCPADVEYPTCDNPKMKYIPECKIDQDCDGEEKCCFSGCRNQCMHPLQDKTGSCPFFDNLRCQVIFPTPSDCKADNQCQGTERCCDFYCRPRCTPTEKIKPGSCPIQSIKCITPPPEPLCTYDRDCPGDQKCCTSDCTQKCTNPL